MSVEELTEALQQKEEELLRLQESFEEYQEMSKNIESELEEEISELKSSVSSLKAHNSELQEEILSMKKDFLSKTLSFERTIQNLSQEKATLDTNFKKIMKITREAETELEECKNSIREKEYELEQVTSFYHQTLEDLAITCSELESIKDSSIENTQRLKDQIAELSQEVLVARRKSRGLSQRLTVRGIKPVPVTYAGKSAIGIVESLISDLTTRLRTISMH